MIQSYHCQWIMATTSKYNRVKVKMTIKLTIKLKQCLILRGKVGNVNFASRLTSCLRVLQRSLISQQAARTLLLTWTHWPEYTSVDRDMSTSRGIPPCVFSSQNTWGLTGLLDNHNLANNRSRYKIINHLCCFLIVRTES